MKFVGEYAAPVAVPESKTPPSARNPNPLKHSLSKDIGKQKAVVPALKKIQAKDRKVAPKNKRLIKNADKTQVKSNINSQISSMS